MEEVDPYKVLGVPKTFTIEQLKTAYKGLAIKLHPDKGGSEYMFNMVTDCFKKLMRDWKRRHSDKSFQDLKSAYKSFEASQPQFETERGDGRFDLKRFNQMFTENRLENITDQGYKDWLNREEGAGRKVPTFKGSTREAFNQHFERHVKAAPETRAVQKYREPQALVSGKIQCYEIGKEKVDDWSGDNMTQKQLNYMDLKIAHSTSRIIDPNSVKYKEYRNVDELQKDRGEVRFEMSPKEREAYQRRLEKQKEEEYRRLEHLRKQDSIAEAHAQRMRNLLRHMRE